jgi:hypothetical protein
VDYPDKPIQYSTRNEYEHRSTDRLVGPMKAEGRGGERMKEERDGDGRRM